MPLLGSFCLLFALALAVYCFVVGVHCSRTQRCRRLSPGGDRPSGWHGDFCRCFLVAAGALVYAAMTTIFPSLTFFITPIGPCPVPINSLCLWSGQEGSMLFWALLLSAYGFVSAAAPQS